MSADDAEAIARVIVDDFSDLVEVAKRHADRTRSTFAINRQHATTLIAGRILSYLASHREAEPVARQWQHHDPIFGNIVWREKQCWNGHRSEVSRELYTAPPSPAPAQASEVERLREVLSRLHGIATAELRNTSHLLSSPPQSSAALNGGRTDE